MEKHKAGKGGKERGRRGKLKSSSGAKSVCKSCSVAGVDQERMAPLTCLNPFTLRTSASNLFPVFKLVSASVSVRAAAGFPSELPPMGARWEPVPEPPPGWCHTVLMWKFTSNLHLSIHLFIHLLNVCFVSITIQNAGEAKMKQTQTMLPKGLASSTQNVCQVLSTHTHTSTWGYQCWNGLGGERMRMSQCGNTAVGYKVSITDPCVIKCQLQYISLLGWCVRINHEKYINSCQ